MPTFLDESGDTGWKPGSLPFFRLAADWLPTLAVKVRFRGFRPDEMLQLVDMVVGAVGERLDGDSTWYDLISARSLGIVRLP